MCSLEPGWSRLQVKDLLELKQQQASVMQAWQAVNQANKTIKQGRSIMMFTLVTIVFVRCSGAFGLPWTLTRGSSLSPSCPVSSE